MTEQAEKPVLLIVDDSKVIRRAASKMLGEDYTVLEARDGLDAWTQIQQDASISVVFTDMQMPEMNGVQLLQNIRESEDDRINVTPVIMITGVDDTETAKKQVFDLGATDFISKPFDSIDLLSRAKSYARLTRKVVELEKQTGVDKLTGLLNTSSFTEQGTKILSFAQRHHLNIAVVHLEIDDFQNIFLTYGKNVAQQILVAVGKRLSENLRTEDDAARIGVARFSLLLPLTNQDTAKTVVDRLREAVNRIVFDTGTEKIRVSLMAGITAYDETDDLVFADLLSHAEQALESALQKQDDKIAYYDVPAPVPEIQPETAVETTQQDLIDAFAVLVDGRYHEIPEGLIEDMLAHVDAFVAYRQDNCEQRLTASVDGL